MPSCRVPPARRPHVLFFASCRVVLPLAAEGSVQEGAGDRRAGDQENHSDHS